MTRLPIMSESFLCVPYNAVIRRAVCATRYVQANKGKQKLGNAATKAMTMANQRCHGCVCGSGHARGESAAPAVPAPKPPAGHVAPAMGPPQKRPGWRTDVSTAEQREARRKGAMRDQARRAAAKAAPRRRVA